MNKVNIISIVAVIIAGAFVWTLTSNRQLNNSYDDLAKQQNELIDAHKLLKKAEQNAIDSAFHYKQLFLEADVKADGLLVDLNEANAVIENIPNLIAEVQSSAAYDSTFKYLPETNSELEYCYDSTQVKKIYADELELEFVNNALDVCNETVIAQREALRLVKLESKFQGIALDTCKNRADEAYALAEVTLEQVGVLEKELKTWKIGTGVGGTVLTVLLILALL